MEERYQAPVDGGHVEREVADRMLTSGLKPQCPDLAIMLLQPPWRIA